jgi:acetyl-CoA acetyltransferase
MGNISGKFAIVGIGETEVGRRSDKSLTALGLQAAVAAMRDAGLEKHEIDGIITHQQRSNPQANGSAFLADRLGLKPAYINDISLSGAAPASMVINAVGAIEAGVCSTVLCASAGGGQALSRDGRGHGKLATGWEDFMHPFGAVAAPIHYALGARRHMHEYGTTSRQLGAIAVACRRHASMNPNAQMRKPITIEDHQNSRMIADPFRLLDCSLVSTGAGAFIVTSAHRAQDLPNRAAHILGMGSACLFSGVTYAEDLTSAAGREASRRAFRMAGLTPADVDVAELYDCFTYTVLVTLEDYGFCEKGEGGPFMENGRIELGGELPINTHGGLLSQAHVGGMLHITEAVAQLRHAAGPRQVEDAEVAVVSSQCGQLGIHVTLLLGGSPN